MNKNDLLCHVLLLFIINIAGGICAYIYLQHGQKCITDGEVNKVGFISAFLYLVSILLASVILGETRAYKVEEAPPPPLSSPPGRGTTHVGEETTV
jgi:cytochrome bd-type quinol oxidase subunit 1